MLNWSESQLVSWGFSLVVKKKKKPQLHFYLLTTQLHETLSLDIRCDDFMHHDCWIVWSRNLGRTVYTNKFNLFEAVSD